VTEHGGVVSNRMKTERKTYSRLKIELQESTILHTKTHIKIVKSNSEIEVNKSHKNRKGFVNKES